jgi:hypothetical protein
MLTQSLKRDLRLQPGVNPPSRLLRHRSLPHAWLFLLSGAWLSR